MHIVSIYNQKGGVGKTSLTVLLGLYSSSLNRTLLIDLDPQESLSQVFKNQSSKGSAYNLLANQLVNDYKTSLLSTSQSAVNDIVENITIINDRLHVIKGDISLLKIQNDIPIDTISNILNRLKGNYDQIFIDLPPTYNKLILSTLKASSTVLIPTLQSDFDLKSLLLSIDVTKSLNKDRVHIIFNRQKAFTREIDKTFKDVIENYITSCFPNSIGIRKDIRKGILSKKTYELVEALYNGMGLVI